MFKGKIVVLSLIAAALLSWQMMPAGVDTANSGIVHPCSSTASSTANPCMLVCPQGDGTRLDATGGDISITVKDGTGAAIAGVPAADFWLAGCTGGLTLCGGSGSSNASAATDAGGNTTMVGTIAAGGYDIGLNVVVQGVIIAGQPACTGNLCLGITAVSPDMNGDLTVQLIDLAIFGPIFLGAYAPTADFNCDGLVNLVDLALLGAHWQHLC